MAMRPATKDEVWEYLKRLHPPLLHLYEVTRENDGQIPFSYEGLITGSLVWEIPGATPQRIGVLHCNSEPDRPPIALEILERPGHPGLPWVRVHSGEAMTDDGQLVRLLTPQGVLVSLIHP
jgi:hypothetical protein